MMYLETQVYTLIFSFFFGLFFAVMLSLNEKFLYHSKKSIKVVATFLFVLVHVLIYFIGIQKINQGIIHPYSFLAIVVGYFVEQIIKNKIVLRRKK